LEGKLPTDWSKTEAAKAFQKRPIEGLLATGGELFGAWLGSKALDVGATGVKRGIIRGEAKLRQAVRPGAKPLIWEKYSPGTLIRRAKFKAGEKLGIAKRVPEEKIWHPEVLVGKEKFAKAAGPKEMLKIFEKTRVTPGKPIVGVHATPYRFGGLVRRKTTIQAGTSELPGLSVSAKGYGSPHFLGLGRLPRYGGRTTIFPKFRLKSPTAAQIDLSLVTRLPKKLRAPAAGESTTAYYARVSKYLKKQKKGPYATIAAKAELGGPEIE
ncbi:unnamed protein product, partial [marine sediment metagenome]